MKYLPLAVICVSVAVTACVKIPERPAETRRDPASPSATEPPKAPRATFESSLADYKSGNFDRAESGFSEVIAADPKNADAHYYLGKIRLDRGDAEKAADPLRQAVKLDGKSVDKMMALGDAMFALKRFDVAIVEYGKIPGFEPDNARAYFMMGRTYVALGNKIGARQQLRKLEPLNKEMAAKLEAEIGD